MSFTKTAVLPVTPDEAFALITEPERLRRWQTVSALVDLRAGGSYRWTVTPGHVAAGTFREVEPGRRIVFGWGWDGDEDLPPDASTVTITVEPADGGSRVTLVHEGLNEEQAKAHAEGWEHYFERLERLAATGDAGPDEWAWAPENAHPISAAQAALAVIQPILRNLTPEDQPKPTPCTDFTCHELAEHLLASLGQLGHGRRHRGHPRGRDRWRTGSRSWPVRPSTPGARSTSTAPARPRRGRGARAFLAGILPLELVLHGWDIAQASGQQLHISDELVDYVRDLAEGIVPGGRGSSFADEVVPAEDATAIDRLAAFAGRTPIAA